MSRAEIMLTLITTVASLFGTATVGAPSHCQMLSPASQAHVLWHIWNCTWGIKLCFCSKLDDQLGSKVLHSADVIPENLVFL